VLPSQQLIPGTSFGVSFTSVTVNAPKHIEFLYRRLKEYYGVRFVRDVLPSLQAAYADPKTRIVFNCTGVAARTFEGVRDTKCYPTRGQVVLARLPEMKRNLVRHGHKDITYVIPRPGIKDHAILGGLMQKGNG
jgi:D-amino-acid oxidase